MRPHVDSPEFGPDPLDPAIGRVGRRWWSWSIPHRQPALGVRPIAAPTLVYMALGVALGPSGLNVLTPGTLYDAQTIAWVALAVVGVFIGLGLRSSLPDAAGPTLITAGTIGLITIATIAGGVFGLIKTSHLPVSAVLSSSVLLGVCASVSAALETSGGTPRELKTAVRLADLDDVPLLLFGTALVAALAGGSLAWRLLATVAGGAAIGVAGWLLFEHADEAERGLYVAGAILLLAGMGAYLGTSPLLSGCSAAIVWTRLPGEADRITARDLHALQHPLVALLLIMAGALTQWSTVVLWVTGYVVILRLGAKLLASVVVHRMATVSPALLASVLLHPGVMGVALAVNIQLVLGADFGWVLSTVTASALVSEILAGFLPYAYEENA